MLYLGCDVCLLCVTRNYLHSLQTLNYCWDIPLQEVPVTKLTPLRSVNARQ